MHALLAAFVQFALHASDPSWSCAHTHRDPGMPGTYYLYCEKTLPGDVQVVEVGSFVPDVAHVGKAAR